MHAQSGAAVDERIGLCDAPWISSSLVDEVCIESISQGVSPLLCECECAARVH